MTNAILTTEPGASLATKFITLKSATGSKLGKHADGSISYSVTCDRERKALFIAITDNSSGGYFSREYVSLDRIQELVVQLNRAAFPSKALKAAFTGKSSNNAGFLAAVLRAEGLLKHAPDNDAKHVMANDWGDWKTALLAQEGGPAGMGSPLAQAVDSSVTLEKNKTATVSRQASRSR
jgi:hypothetical protein